MESPIVYKGYKIERFEYRGVSYKKHSNNTYSPIYKTVKYYKIFGFAKQFDTIKEAKEFLNWHSNLSMYKEPN